MNVGTPVSKLVTLRAAVFTLPEKSLGGYSFPLGVRGLNYFGSTIMFQMSIDYLYTRSVIPEHKVNS